MPMKQPRVRSESFNLGSQKTENLLSAAINFCEHGGADNLRFARYHIAELVRRKGKEAEGHTPFTNNQLRAAHALMVNNSIHSSENLCSIIVDILEAEGEPIRYATSTEASSNPDTGVHADQS